MTNDHLNVIMEDGKPNPDVWAIGDAAQITDAILPATAQGKFLLLFFLQCIFSFTFPVASQKGKYVMKKVNRLVRDRESPDPFAFHNQGSLAYIGNWSVSIE